MRLYDRLFSVANPDSAANPLGYEEVPEPRIARVISDAKIEPALADGISWDVYFQFEQIGYFYPDIGVDRRPPDFNRTVSLKDTWAKIAQKV